MTDQENQPDELPEYASKLALLLRDTKVVLESLHCAAELRKAESSGTDLDPKVRKSLEIGARMLHSLTLKSSLETTHNACAEHLMSLLPHDSNENTPEDDLTTIADNLLD